MGPRGSAARLISELRVVGTRVKRFETESKLLRYYHLANDPIGPCRSLSAVAALRAGVTMCRSSRGAAAAEERGGDAAIAGLWRAQLQPCPGGAMPPDCPEPPSSLLHECATPSRA